MTTELGRLINDLVNAAHRCGAAEDSTNGEQYEVLWSAQVAAEKALLEYVEGIQQANRLLQHEYDDNERWQKEVLADFKIAYDDHTTGRRMALTQWMADRLAELRALLK